MACNGMRRLCKLWCRFGTVSTCTHHSEQIQVKLTAVRMVAGHSRATTVTDKTVVTIAITADIITRIVMHRGESICQPDWNGRRGPRPRGSVAGLVPVVTTAGAGRWEGKLNVQVLL